MSSSAALEQRLGHRFSDRRLLEQALTHRSHGPQNNERLEFLGDGVLGCAVAEALYARFPELSEGQLTRMRASLVREEALADVAGQLGLVSLLHLGESERAAGTGARPSVLADAVEALVGAVFLDAGYEAARDAVLRAFAPLMDRLDPVEPQKDPKTQLQEIMQARRQRLPEYRIVSVKGAAHRQSFEVECRLTDAGLSASGAGTSRQRAEQDAALAMLAKLEA